jgi:CheY-like chemotaxis protein
MKKDIEEALNAGCNDFISKPINEKIFREMINKHL